MQERIPWPNQAPEDGVHQLSDRQCHHHIDNEEEQVFHAEVNFLVLHLPALDGHLVGIKLYEAEHVLVLAEGADEDL